MSIFDSISNLVLSSAESALPVNLNNYNIPPENKRVVFITQYHFCGNLDRDAEILECINRNINNPIIDKVILFTENLSKEDVEVKINLNSKTTLINLDYRISFSSVFKYIHQEPNLHGDSSNIYLLSNSDCYFDESLNTLKYINFEERPSPLFLTMTRYEDFCGSLQIGKNPFTEQWHPLEYNGIKDFIPEEYEKLPFLEPWSSDAWAFKFNSIDWIKENLDEFQNELGTAMCELLLVDNLLKLQVECKNIGLAGYIKCIHKHKSLYREKKNISKKIEDYIPGIVPDPPKGILRTKENTINGSYRLLSKKNWLDAPQKEHAYSDFFVRDLSILLNRKKCTI